MFQTLIVQPIFNILVFIYALLPGHNFGLALILFTILVRLMLWPLVKKQLHQTKVMRKMQPELRRIKKEAGGDRQKEAALVMELYKERGISPFGSIGLLLLQLPILIALYSGLTKVVKDSTQMVEFAYPALQHFAWMERLAANPKLFDETLFGLVDLTRAAVSSSGLYWPAMVIVVASVIAQYYQSKQLLPSDKNARKLRDIFREASEGKQTDQTEVSAAMSRIMIFILPAVIFFSIILLASALGLYLLVGSLVALIQQGMVLKDDEAELEELADEPLKSKHKKNSSAKISTTKELEEVPEAEVVAAKQAAMATTTTPTPKPAKTSKTTKKKGSKKKRRK